jgi:hypothetical protein
LCDHNIEIQSSDFEHELAPRDWVLSPEENRADIFAADPHLVNGATELNPAKLGWFRPADAADSGVQLPPEAVLGRALEVATSDCDAHSFGVTFHGTTAGGEFLRIRFGPKIFAVYFIF